MPWIELHQYQELTAPVFIPAAAPATPDLSWQPEYPDILRAQRLTTVVHVFEPPPSVRALGHDGWLPTYPDTARAASAVVFQQFLAFDVFPRPDVFFFEPVYPSKLFQVYVPPASGESAPPSSVQPLGHIGWEPEYPDVHWRHTLRLQRWEVLDPFPPAAPVVQDIGWLGNYPDQVVRRPLIPVTFRATEVSISMAPPNDLSWKPEYPDPIWRIFLSRAAVQAFATRLDAPAETVLSAWEPSFPSFVLRRTLPTAMREGNSIAAVIEQAVAPLKWEPRMPVRLYPRHLPRALYPSFFEGVPGELIAIGQRMAWKFHEPEWIRRHPPLVPGEAFYTIPPFVPAAEHECVELIDDSFGVPALIQQVFTAPTLLEEGLTVPQLVEQDLC